VVGIVGLRHTVSCLIWPSRRRVIDTMHIYFRLCVDRVLTAAVVIVRVRRDGESCKLDQQHFQGLHGRRRGWRTGVR
jgi:hypothetical protein